MDIAPTTCLSLCSGYAGLELGLRRVVPALRTVCYVEIELFAVANLVAKMEAGLLDAAPVWTDIKTFPAERFRGKVDIITGGYPCQPFSVAGKRNGESDPRHLWPYIAAIVRAVEPVWCFFENVPGHLTLGFPAVYRSLRQMGYSLETGLFTAAEVGAPHKRERLFILAHRPGGGRRELRGTQCEGSGGLAKSGGDMADAAGQRVQGPEPTWAALPGGQTDEHGGCDRWPAGPGQPQYEWEEPRVVADTARRSGRTHQPGRGQEERTVSAGPSETICEGPLEPTVGKSIDGRTCGLVRSRVDQLRLLGNGVVPAQAERAFRELMKRFT